MAAMSIEIKMPRRRAEVQISSHWARKLGIEAGVYSCHVLGIFQYAESEADAYPVFACELDNGRMIEVSPTDVKFVDTKEGIIL